MNSLPFLLNIFKQLEIFQDIKRFDEQFDLMLTGWKKGDYKKLGLAKGININYPTWEIEKKILLWTSKHHKHLGSPITTNHLHIDNVDFLKDVHISQAELVFAGSENVLKNLVARGFAIWDKGALVSQQGFAYGLIIDAVFRLTKENSVKIGETKYRDEKLEKKRLTFIGYEFMYLAGLLVILLSLLLLAFSIYTSLNLHINLPLWFVYIKYIIIFVSFMPVILFSVGICLLKVKK